MRTSPSPTNLWSWPWSPVSEKGRLPVDLMLHARYLYCFLGSPPNSHNLSNSSLLQLLSLCLPRISPTPILQSSLRCFPPLQQKRSLYGWCNHWFFDKQSTLPHGRRHLVSNLSFFWVLSGFSEDVMDDPKKIWVRIFSCSFLNGPTSSKITRTLGKLKGYTGFGSSFILCFLFCIRPVITDSFSSYLEGLWQYIALVTLYICNIYIDVI